MNSSIRSSLSIALVSIVALAYIGFCYGIFTDIAPPDWFRPTNPLSLIGSAFGIALIGIVILGFWLSTPFALIAPAALACANYFRPREFARRQLLLALPMFPVFSLPIWAAYVYSYRPKDAAWGAYLNSWELHVLEALGVAVSIPIVVAAIFVLVSPRWKRMRIFALSILVLESIMSLGVYGSATWDVANVCI